MRNVARTGVALFLAAVAFGSLSTRATNVAVPAAAGTAKMSMVAISQNEFRSYESALRNEGFDVAGIDVREKKVFLVVDRKEMDRLAALGVHIDNRMALTRPLTAPDSKYKTPDQVVQILQKLAADHPDIAVASSIGKSLEGREIYALKITKDAATPNTKPSVLYNGMHHAREVMSAEVPLDIADYLLTHYGTDSKVTHWVDAYNIYVLPMLNVDGNNKVWTENSMWRKNGRGVDINRNYPYAWNSCSGSSGNEWAQDYRGPSPASEPETNVLMNFVASIHPVFNISFHSFSEIVIYPYGCGQHTDKKDIVEPIGKKMGELIPTDAGDGHYTAGIAPDLLYAVDGDDVDWMYHEQSVIPYVIEVNGWGQGFQPSYDQWRDKTVTKIRPAWQYLLERMDGPSLTGTIASPNFSSGSTLHIVSADPAKPFAQNYRMSATGAFNVILNPGIYDVSVRNGVTKRVKIGTGPTKLAL